MTEDERQAVATTIMETRRRWGWTLGFRRPRVMAIDLMMATAAIDAFQKLKGNEDGLR